MKNSYLVAQWKPIISSTLFPFPLFFKHTAPSYERHTGFRNSTYRLQAFWWNICTGLKGLIKKQISRLQRGYRLAKVHRTYSGVQKPTGTSLMSCVSPGPVLIAGCGSREWKHFKLCRKGLWSLSNSSQYGRGKNLLELFLHEERIASCSALGNFRLWLSNVHKHTFTVFNCRVWVGTTSEEYVNIPIGYLNNEGLRFCLCIYTCM